MLCKVIILQKCAHLQFSTVAARAERVRDLQRKGPSTQVLMDELERIKDSFFSPDMPEDEAYKKWLELLSKEFNY